MSSAYTIKSRIWISLDDRTLLGEGRIALLTNIEKFGSISKAAKAMGMSYKKAWELVNSINSHFDEPIVVGAVGGVNGGGSSLSDTGRELITVFKKLEDNNRRFLQEEMKKINVFNKH